MRSSEGFLCHKHRAKVSYEIHHVWPVGYHGPDRAWNKIKICCNAHSDIHYLMELILKGKPYVARDYGPRIRLYAIKGAQQVMAYAESIKPARS